VREALAPVKQEPFEIRLVLILQNGLGDGNRTDGVIGVTTRAVEQLETLAPNPVAELEAGADNISNDSA
jgi:hypothetical protein